MLIWQCNVFTPNSFLLPLDIQSSCSETHCLILGNNTLVHYHCLEVCLIQKVSLKTKQKQKQTKKSSFKLASALPLSSSMLDTESVTENKTKKNTHTKNKNKKTSSFKLASRPIASLYYSCTFVRFHSEETTRNITSARR